MSTYGPNPPLILTIQRNVLENVDDTAGRWQFSGGEAHRDGKHFANFIGIKRVVFGATEEQNTASLTVTYFILGEKPPQNLTLQGTHDFNSGNQIGSVSAASIEYSALIGATFLRSGNTVTIGG